MTDSPVRDWLHQQLGIEPSGDKYIKQAQIIARHLLQWKRTLTEMWMTEHDPQGLGAPLGQIEGKNYWLMTNLRPTRVKIISLGTLSPDEKLFNAAADARRSDEEPWALFNLFDADYETWIWVAYNFVTHRSMTIDPDGPWDGAPKRVMKGDMSIEPHVLRMMEAAYEEYLNNMPTPFK